MYFISSFYRFTKVDAPEELKSSLLIYSEQASLLGLVILAPEGINATIAGTRESVEGALKLLSSKIDLTDTIYKESVCELRPFRKFVVKIREEIVTTSDRPDVVEGDSSLSPQEWDQLLDSDEDVILIDTRNDYEVEIGKFKGAVDPKIENFKDFVSYIESHPLPKDKKLLLYCTGGVRCEKAIQTMHKAGYENAFHLRGGILKYIEQYPNKHFEGECFVFDDRVAVDQELNASSKYGFCPLCGSPAQNKIICPECYASAKICPNCLKAGKQACSLRCAHMLYGFARQEA